MEYTELAAYQLHAGNLTTWFPTTVQKHWRADPRPLSYNHEAHVRYAAVHGEPSKESCAESLEATPRGDNWIGTAFRIHQEFDAEAVRETLQQWIARHEVYRTTAVADASGQFHRETLPADAIEFIAHTVGEVSEAASASLILENHFATTVSTTSWPHLTIATIRPDSYGSENSEDSDNNPWFTVVFAADHAVMDAYTQIVSIAELRELYAAYIAQRPADLPSSGSHIDYSELERGFADNLTIDHSAVQRWKKFLCSTGHLPTPPRLTLLSENCPQQGGRSEESQQISRSVWLLDDADAASFGQVSKRLGGSQMTGLLAGLKLAIARASRNSEGERSLRYIMPMHTRISPEYALSAGWFVGLMPIEDPMPQGMTFAEAVPATTEAVKENRDLVAYPYPRIAELLGVIEPPQFVVSFVDARFIPGAEAWTPHDRTLRGVSYSTTDVYIWIVRTRAGLNISMRYPRDSDVQDTMCTLVGQYLTVLHSVVHTGDAYSLPFGTPQQLESVREA